MILRLPATSLQTTAVRRLPLGGWHRQTSTAREDAASAMTAARAECAPRHGAEKLARARRSGNSVSAAGAQAAAEGPLGRRTADARWPTGSASRALSLQQLRPLGRWAAGPLGRWAAGPLGRWAAGPLGRWAAGPLGRWACIVQARSAVEVKRIVGNSSRNVHGSRSARRVPAPSGGESACASCTLPIMPPSSKISTILCVSFSHLFILFRCLLPDSGQRPPSFVRTAEIRPAGTSGQRHGAAHRIPAHRRPVEPQAVPGCGGPRDAPGSSPPFPARPAGEAQRSWSATGAPLRPRRGRAGAPRRGARKPPRRLHGTPLPAGRDTRRPPRSIPASPPGGRAGRPGGQDAGRP